jgi:hypothetical protein
MKVMLLDWEWDQTVFLTYYLARAGIEVTLVANRIPMPRGLGRWCQQVLPPISLKEPEYLRSLLAEDVDWIIPLAEDLQAFYWGLPNTQTAKVFPTTTARQRELLGNRHAMDAMARSVGVPVPEMARLDCEEDAVRAGAVLGWPLVLRGTSGYSGQQVRVVHGPEEAAAAYRELQEASPGNPFAQAFIEGNRCLIGAVLDQGRMLQWFSQMAIEVSRPPLGPSLRIRSLRDRRLEGYAGDLFRELGWSGLACAEFVRTADGRYCFMEINPRPWASIHAAHRCGVPLMTSFARYLMGQEVSGPVDFPDGKEVTLFPQFFLVRIRSRQFGRWRDRRAYLQALAGVPWQHMSLLRHFFWQILWSRP